MYESVHTDIFEKASRWTKTLVGVSLLGVSIEANFFKRNSNNWLNHLLNYLSSFVFSSRKDMKGSNYKISLFGLSKSLFRQKRHFLEKFFIWSKVASTQRYSNQFQWPYDLYMSCCEISPLGPWRTPNRRSTWHKFHISPISTGLKKLR